MTELFPSKNKYLRHYMFSCADVPASDAGSSVLGVPNPYCSASQYGRTRLGWCYECNTMRVGSVNPHIPEGFRVLGDRDGRNTLSYYPERVGVWTCRQCNHSQDW